MTSLRSEFKRLFSSGTIWLSVLLMLAVELLTTIHLLKNRCFAIVNVIEQVMIGTGSNQVLLLIIPVLPFAMTYALDVKDRAVAFWMCREGSRQYARNRVLTACFGAAIAFVLTQICFSLLLLALGHPLTGASNSGENYGYGALLPGHDLAYLALWMLDRCCSCAMTASGALLLTGLYPSIYLAINGPVAVYLLLLRLTSIDALMRWNPIWYPGTWMDSFPYNTGTWYETLLLKMIISVIVCLVEGWLFYRLVRRRHISC